MILLVVAAIAAAVITIKALIAVNEALKKHFAEVSERLKPFSASIQAADARGEVAKLRDDVRAARNIGPMLGRFNEAQGRIERAVDRVYRAIEGPLLDVVVPFIEYAGNNLEVLSKAAEQISEIARRLDIVKGPLVRIQEDINRMLGVQINEANKLPPEMDILGAFNKKPDLAVTWRGLTFGADEDKMIAGPGGNGAATFENPLPKIGVP